MRPKLIALIAVSTLALVGCSTSAPSGIAPGEPSANSQSSEQCDPNDVPEGMVCDPMTMALMTESEFKAAAEAKAEPAPPTPEEIEDDFVEFAKTRAEVHTTSSLAPASELIENLHSFCENGEPIDVSISDALNENLEIIAKRGTCESLTR